MAIGHYWLLTAQQVRSCRLNCYKDITKNSVKGRVCHIRDKAYNRLSVFTGKTAAYEFPDCGSFLYTGAKIVDNAFLPCNRKEKILCRFHVTGKKKYITAPCNRKEKILCRFLATGKKYITAPFTCRRREKNEPACLQRQYISEGQKQSDKKRTGGDHCDTSGIRRTH